MAAKFSCITLTQGPDIWYLYASGALLEHIKESEFGSMGSGVRRI